MTEWTEWILHSLLDTAKLLPFLFLTYLLMEFLGHGLAGSFIFLIHLMAESGRFHIKSHSKIIRLFFIQDPEHNVQESVYSVGMNPF